jgi:hypothetical protein
MPRKPHVPYDVKFEQFLKLCAQAKAQGALSVLIHHPEVLGDTYGELLESLNRLAQAELALRIVPPSERARHGRD